MLVYLLRHGIAADLGGSVRRDEDRPLTDEGRVKMKLQAKGMRRLELKFDYIFTSPYLRTRQTAEVVAAEFGMEKKLVEVASLAAGRAFAHRWGNNADALVEVGAYSCESALLVGHWPDVAELASVLLTGERNAAIDFKKGALAAVEVAGLPPRSPGVLRWLLAPKQLQLIGKS